MDDHEIKIQFEKHMNFTLGINTLKKIESFWLKVVDSNSKDSYDLGFSAGYDKAKDEYK